MEEDEELKANVQIETIEIQCKIEVEEETEIKVERDSDADDGSIDDLQYKESPIETSTSQGIKRNKGYTNKNIKKKKEEESGTDDDDIEEVQSNDPLDVSDDLTEKEHLNIPHISDPHILENFTRWQDEKQLTDYKEETFLLYFNDLAVHMDPASLWNTYCSLKLLLSNRGIDMNKYHKLKYYIRKITDGYREKESRVFTFDDIKRFLKYASDDTHLVWKVALIIGVTGGCRCNELKNLRVDDLKLHGDKAIINIQESSKKQRSYVITQNYARYIKKYLEIRPKNFPVERLLVPCKYNEFCKQAMGKKKIGLIPAGVARFLNLPHADEYTGHTYRRTFALFNPLKQSNTFNSDNESDNEIENLDNKVDNHDNRTTDSNRKLPAKIYNKFLEVHNLFKQWMKRMKVPYIFEDCVLTYFRELAKNYKPMSLWKLFTMLRYSLLSTDKLDIRSYKDVTDYLNVMVEESKEHVTGTFTTRDIDVFIKEAPDDCYLGTKVVLLLGVSGACNCQELINLTTGNITRYGTIIIVKLKDSNKKNKTFIIPDNYFYYINKYIELRPKDLIFDKFLILFKNGKFTKSTMGQLSVRSVPRDVASFLKKPNADEFTGHFLRRTAFVLFNLTTIFINDGDDSDNEVENPDNKVEKLDKLIDKCPSINKFGKRNDIDKQVENTDNKIEKLDKLKVTPNKCPSQTIVKQNHNEIDNKRYKIDNNKNNQDLDDDIFEITPDILEDQSQIDNKTGWHPRYDEIYNYFIRWLDTKPTKTINEDTMLIYFNELAEKFKPSTLWSQFYVLKRTLIIKNNIDLSDYYQLKDLLKKKADGFRSTKSRVFTLRQIDEFLEKAPDDIYLHWKVALILGIKGACKNTELLYLTTDNIKLEDNIITVRVQETKNRKRKFFITDHYYPYVKKYINLRPSECKTDRFLLLIKNKKVIKACVGKNTIYNMPKEIALFLNLPFPEEYNGHCFRATSMTLFSHDALVRSNRQAGHLNVVGHLSKARNEAGQAENEADTAGNVAENETHTAWNEADKSGNRIDNETYKAGNEGHKAGIWSENEAHKAVNKAHRAGIWSQNEAHKAGNEIHRAVNKANRAENWSVNDSGAVSWPENDGKRALCWPLTIEHDDDELEADDLDDNNQQRWTLNCENGVLEMVDPEND